MYSATIYKKACMRCGGDVEIASWDDHYDQGSSIVCKKEHKEIKYEEVFPFAFTGEK